MNDDKFDNDGLFNNGLSNNRLSGTRLISIVAGLCCCVLAIVLMVWLTKTPKSAPAPEAKPSIVATKPQEAPNPLLGENDTLGLVHGVGNEEILVAIPSDYTTKHELIHPDVLTPLLSMIHEASQDGVDITVVSAYRSYERQKQIWESKWGDSLDEDVARAEEILRYSSFPGTSRHHWGTDVDFNNVSPAYWKSVEGQEVFAWLQANAPRFGFCQTYGKGRVSGYEEEAWHWSHMPTAHAYYLTLSQMSALSIALNQDVKGASAIRQIAPEMMYYITDINACQVSGIDTP